MLLELGLFGDGTSFGEFNIKDICTELQKIGFESKGNELLYDGQSGEQIRSNIFIGPAFYQRLKHMVNDKQHSRSIGPMVNLTRQPAEGRSRDGGLRYGEMEKDAMVAHGASQFNKERLLYVSDLFVTQVCKKCGMLAAFNNKEHIHKCRFCNNTTDFKDRQILQATQNKIIAYVNEQSEAIEYLLKQLAKAPTVEQINYYKRYCNEARFYIKNLGGNPSNLNFIMNKDIC